MEMDYYYIKIFLSPILGFSIAALMMKCCCKRLCFGRSSMSEVERHNTPIYVIPVHVNDNNSDIDSLSSAAEFAPPAYDSITSVIPPPPYSERKISIPDEEPPAYAEIMEAPSFTGVLPPQTQQT